MNTPELPESSAAEPVIAYRQSRRVKMGGSGCAAFAFGIVGLMLLFSPLFLIGILVLVVGFLVDAKKGHVFFCGACGNDVAPTAQICPHCAAELVAEPRRWLTFKNALAALILLVFATIAFGMMKIVKNEQQREEVKKTQSP